MRNKETMMFHSRDRHNIPRESQFRNTQIWDLCGSLFTPNLLLFVSFPPSESYKKTKTKKQIGRAEECND